MKEKLANSARKEAARNRDHRNKEKLARNRDRRYKDEAVRNRDRRYKEERRTQGRGETEERGHSQRNTQPNEFQRN